MGLLVIYSGFMMRINTLSLILFAMLLHQSANAWTIISGADKKVHKTVIATDSQHRKIMIFWTTESLKNFKGRVSLRFNRSADGGGSWETAPIPFAGNAKSRWVSDYLPALCFDKSAVLHAVWLQADNKTAPRYSKTTDLGRKWTVPVIIGKEKAIWRGGVSLAVDTNDYSMELNPFPNADASTTGEEAKPGQMLWSMYDEYRLYGVMVEADSVKWHSVPTKISRKYNGPGKVLCALQHGKSRYILRLQQGKKLFLLRRKAGKWSSRLVFQAEQKLEMADNHSFAVDSQGGVYVVFACNGKLNCLRTKNFNEKWESLRLSESQGIIRVPVIGMSGNNRIVVACQVDGLLEGKKKNVSRIAYLSSPDQGQSWTAFKLLPDNGTNQVLPDMTVANDRLFISCTRDKQAAFMAISLDKKN